MNQTRKLKEIDICDAAKKRPPSLMNDDGSRKIKLYRNTNKCTTCRGECCYLYLDPDIGGSRDPEMWFEDWCLIFEEETKNCGVEPLFDPLIVHLTGNEYMIKELMMKGINPYACQYLGLNGCRIPWDKRPEVCREWKCELFDASDAVEF